MVQDRFYERLSYVRFIIVIYCSLSIHYIFLFILALFLETLGLLALSSKVSAHYIWFQTKYENTFCGIMDLLLSSLYLVKIIYIRRHS